MTYHNAEVDLLARLFQWPDDLPHERRRADLERTVLPMVRSALRSGRGAAPLVSWVRRNKPAAPAGDGQALPIDWAARALCRQLCTLLLEDSGRRSVPAGARETVAGC
jgi:hypothetical protein